MLNATILAQRILLLAYRASHAVGAGILHDQPNLPDDVVLKQLYTENRGDGAVVARSDYVIGRMVKLNFIVHPNFVIETTSPWNDTPRIDYQSWAGTYPTCTALYNAAKKSLDLEYKAK